MSVKRKSLRFAPWDAAGMAAHLEAMEAKGWQFRGTDWLGRWEYEECLTQPVRYAVTYAPSRRDWKLTPTESELDLEDLCFDAGWRKVAALSKFHIYRNPDPDATDLETDELTRLDTLDRAVWKPMIRLALIFLLWSVLILGILAWAFSDNLPRALALPSLPLLLAFPLWLIADQAVPLLLYRRWLKRARQSAEAGLPCPAVTGWRLFSRISSVITALLLLGMLTGGHQALILTYAVIVLAFYGLRWYLEHRMEDEALAENLFQVSLVVLFLLMLAVNRGFQAAESLEIDPVPLTAQDLVDTSDMALCFYEMNSASGPLASYHDYWEPDNNSSFSLRCIILDLHLPILEERCRDWFTEDFADMASRMETAVEPADPALWNAEEARRTENSWLIFYDGRIAELQASWDLTEDQIAAAAAKLAP